MKESVALFLNKTLGLADWLVAPVVWSTAIVGFVLIVALQGLESPVTIEPGSGVGISRIHILIFIVICVGKLLLPKSRNR